VRRMGLVLLALALLAPLAGPAAASDKLSHTGERTDRYLTVGEVRDVLHRSTKFFLDCFVVHLGANEPGEVNLSLEVTRAGDPEEIFVEIDPALEGLRQCLVGVTEKMTFDDHDGDPMEVAYPLVFVRDDQGSRVIPYPIVFVRPRPRDFLLLHLPPTLTPEQRESLTRALFP
jgi:hypothetical protein